VVPAVGVVHLCSRCAGEVDLPRERAGPDNDGSYRDERQAEEPPCTPSVWETVEDEEADDQSAEYSAKTLERGVQSSCMQPTSS
jgi:hypothetical protein